MFKLLLVIPLYALSHWTFAQQVKPGVVIVETTIVAGKQAPKFLSIVPWRLRRNMTLDNKPIPIVSQPLPAIEPKEFQQTLRLLKQINTTQLTE